MSAVREFRLEGEIPFKGREKNGGARSRGGRKLWCLRFKDSELRKRDKSKEGRSRIRLNPNYDDPEAR